MRFFPLFFQLTYRPRVLELPNRPSPVYSAHLFSIAAVVATVVAVVVDVVVVATTNFSN